MRLLRRFGLFVTGMVFRSMLLLTVAASAAVVISGNAAHIKQALVETNAYERFVPSIIEANTVQMQSSESIPLNNPEITAIINQSFPAEMLQQNAEKVIDSFYSWLNAKTVTPAFRVDLTENKTQLAEGLGSYAVNRLAAQPVCTILPAQINPFTANCQPAGFSPQAQESLLVEQISNSPGLLPKTVFTAEDLPKVKSGRVITERYNYAPRLYSIIMWSPWIFGLILAGSGAGLVFLHRNKKIGLYRIGFEILSNGVLFMASPIIFGYIVPAVTKNVDLPSTSGAGTQTIMNDVIRYYSGFYDNFFINAGIYFSLAGLLAIVAARALQAAGNFGSIQQQAGLVSSNAPRIKREGKEILSALDVPIQSSESNVVSMTPKRTTNQKYRTIPKKEM